MPPRITDFTRFALNPRHSAPRPSGRLSGSPVPRGAALRRLGARLGGGAALSIMFCTAMAGTAQAKRLALIVGNAEYDNVYSLKNATNDARDVAAALERLDFEVTLLTDMDRAALEAEVAAFAERADAEDVESTLFFFSGHAFQLDGVNYLMPSDAALSDKASIQQATWRLDDIVRQLEDRNRQTLIFLDACRNNPLPENARAGQAEGLAKMQTGSGTFVAFATQPNNVTADGAGDNSPFTEALLNHVESSGISISDMMIRVRNEVESATFGKQTPWDQSSLRAQFYFAPQVERSAELTDADYEMIAALDPEIRARLLAALGNSGVAIEIEEVEDEVEAKRLASVTPDFIIEDPDADLSDLEAAAAAQAEAEVTPAVVADAPQAQPADVTPGFEIVDVPEPETPGTATGEAATQVASAERTRPALPDAAGVTANTAATGIAGATQAEPATAQPGETLRLADALPADPTREREIMMTGSGEEALVLAHLSPSRSLEPIFEPRSRVPGEELTREAAADVGIDLPEEVNDLEGRELALAVQTELQRLGCYRSGLDGLWGRGSALGMARYYATKKTAAATLDPSMQVLRVLKTEPKVVCEVAVEQKNQRVAAVKAKVRKQKAAEVKAAAPVRKAAPAKKKITIRAAPTTTTNSSGQQKTIKRMNTGVFR
ncbi:MAG: hypothetical protein CL813_11705 [Confluentimicrobium sp.]|nr:hypothetical protein [Actibacterium sp.]MBF53590.1 hypothetical protein [Actibacterium sp.]